MSIKIVKRTLHQEEINILIEEIKKFPNPVFCTKKRWQNFKCVYIILNNNKLVGICEVIKINNWIKLGPFIVLQKYQGKGYGKMIFQKIIDDYPNNNLFVGSRNPAVHKIAVNLGFKEELSFWKLPNEIKSTLFDQILESFHFEYLKELIRKRSIQQGPYRYFIRHK
jgi:hypothetical protein